MDIKSLYTVIPNNDGFRALAHFLDKRQVKEPSTAPLTRLAELVLTLNAFSFNGDHYRQVSGVAMGSKMGPNYACLLVGFVEDQILEQYNGFIPQLYRRYIDDVVDAAYCAREDLDNFVEYISNFRPALQFTHTITEDGDLPFLDIKLSISEERITTSVHYKPTDTHSYLHHSSSHPLHCKKSIPYSKLLRIRRLCSVERDFQQKAHEMCTFFEKRGYSRTALKHDLQRVSRVSRRDAIQAANVATNGTERIPLVLTYHPFNNHIKKILLTNFNILMNDETTKEIFPLPPLTSYRRDQNIRDILVHTFMQSQSGSQAGTYPCGAPRCRTCAHVSATTIIEGPRHNITIREHFTCKSSNVIYCISCRRCPSLYIGETGRMLRERTGEHLRTITRNPPGFPVAEHFNMPGHGLDDMEVRCIKQWKGTNTARRRDQMRLIFHLGTLRPHGLNVDFIF